MNKAPKKIWMATDDAFDEYTHQFDDDVAYIRADLVDGLVKALEEWADSKNAEAEYIAMDKARAALKALEEE